ncbi:MAG: EAL domain-containing protein [Pseudomonadota bacterium]
MLATAILQAGEAARSVLDVRGALTQGAVIGGFVLSGALFVGLSALRRAPFASPAPTAAAMLLAAAAMETAIFGYAPARSVFIGAFFAAALMHVASLVGAWREGWKRWIAPGLAALSFVVIAFGAAFAPGGEGDQIALILLAGVAPAAVVIAALAGRKQARYAAPGVILAAAALPAAFLGVIDGRQTWLANFGPHTAFALGLALVAFVALGTFGAGPRPPSRPSPEKSDDETLSAVMDYAGFAVWDWRAASGAVATDAARRLIAPGVDGPRGLDALRSALDTESLALFDQATRANDDGAFDIPLSTRAGRRLRMRGARAAGADGPERVLAIFDETGTGPQRPPAASRPVTESRPEAALKSTPEPGRPASFRPRSDKPDRRQKPRREADAQPSLAALGGLRNRSAFLVAADDALARASDEDGMRRAMFVIDLDRFKTVNDAFGESGGDILLGTVAERLKTAEGPRALIGRHGEDSFAVWALIDARGPSVKDAAERLRVLVCEPVDIQGSPVHPAASVGASLAREEETFAATLLGEAELALADAKTAGGDCVVVYDAAKSEPPAERFGREQALRDGIEAGEIEAHYQPVIRLADGAAAGFEALVRWRRSDEALVPPSEFLALAEESGLLEKMERQVLDIACRDLAAWRRETGRGDVFVAVNVSSRRLDRPQDRLAFVQAVRDALSAHRLPRGALRIEVTEDQIMRNPDGVEQALRAVKELGAGLALDDFGAGHSSLARLRRFDFDVLKIDQAFVKTLDADTDNVAIARSIVNLAHDLGMTVVAEGAENEATARRLRTMGCEYAQGFIFGAPMAYPDATRFLSLYGVDA